jgi:hypothetical protein
MGLDLEQPHRRVKKKIVHMPLSLSGLCSRQPLVARNPGRDPAPGTADIKIEPWREADFPERACSHPQRSIQLEMKGVGTSA